MASEVKDRTAAAIEAFSQGKDVGAAVGDDPVGGGEDADLLLDEEVDEDLDDAGDDLPTEDEPKPAKGAKAKTDSAKPKADTEEFEADGKKILIDYSNKDAIRKAHAEAAGMRKFQRERDEARSQLKAFDKLKKDHEEVSSLWTKLETAFASEGIDGVVKAVTQGQSSLDKLVEERAAKMLKMSQASPAERALMEKEDKWEQEVKRREAIERKLADIEKRDVDLKKQADQTALESAIHPAFNANRFAGKLGDPDVEHRFDKALWANVKSMLADLPEDEPVTAAMVSDMFKEEASVIGRMLQKTAETKADKIVKDRKVAAKEAAQGAVQSGQQTSSSRKDFAKKIKGGDIGGALEDLLTGKTRI
jgi:hypothetical protein